MATTLAGNNPRLFLDSLREYALEPLDTALEILEREKRELSAERTALEEFATVVESVEPEPPSTRPLVLHSKSESAAIDIVRTGYVETLFTVDHYQRAYGEGVLEGIGEEFGWDFAAALEPESGIRFSAPLKESLLAAIKQSIEERETFEQRVRAEQQSVATHRRTVRELLDSLDSSVVPEWFREQMESKIQRLLNRRQQTLNKRSQPFDSHDFRDYLYQEAPWTYPVLTAVARLRESVSFQN